MTGAPLRDSRRSLARFGSVLLWMLSFLLLLGSEPRWLGESVRIFDPAEAPLMAANSAWIPPLAGIAQSWMYWPFWMFAAAGAALIAWSVQRLQQIVPAALALIPLTGWSLLMQPRDLVPGLLMMTAAGLLRRPGLKPLGVNVLLITGGVTAVGALVSIEFGLIAAVACLLPVMRRDWTVRDVRWHLASVTGGLAVLAIGANWFPAFLRTAMRPLNWAWLADSGLLNQIGPAWQSDSPILGRALLMGFALLCAVRAWTDRSRPVLELPAMAFFVLLGISCVWYFWLGLFTAMLFVQERPWPPPIPRLNAVTLGAGFALAITRLSAHSTHYMDFVVNGSLAPHRVDPGRWSIQGPVLLLRLEHAEDWRSPERSGRFPLLFDDRWDVPHSQWNTYAELCHDIREDQADGYVRTDGQRGGYRRWMNAWNPVLLDVPSDDIVAIRRLSMSPHWRLMGIDGRRTLFGNTRDPQTAPAMQRAVNAALTLEWPGPAFQGIEPNVIVVSDDNDARRVARVLCAMRLPYAALRVVAGTEGDASERVRSACYLELAHRTFQQTGQVSLLDQYRGACGVRRQLDELRREPDELLRLAGTLESLGASELASICAVHALNANGLDGPSESDRKKAAAITRSSWGQNEDGRRRVQEPTESDAESAIRAALRSGDESRCRELLPSLEPSIHPYYAAICSSPDRVAEELLAELRLVQESNLLPERLRDEVRFTVASLAIECRDSEAAVALLREAASGPASPYQALERFYLNQLENR